MANVQIPESLFSQLCAYFLLGRTDLRKDITQGLNKKLNAIKARQEYAERSNGNGYKNV